VPLASACPDPALLEQFLLGRVTGAEADRLEGHLVACPGCAAALRTLRAEDDLVAAMRDCEDTPAAPQAGLVEALLPVLKRLRRPDETTTLAPGTLAGAPPDRTAPGSEAAFLAPAQGPDEVGRLGSYRVLKRLGAGGMGVVFLAEDPRLKRHVALKVIRPELAAHEDARRRFLHEAQAAAAIEHENIVPVYQADEDRGVPFLAMQLLRGESLEERLGRAEGPLPVDEVLRVGREVAEGLAAAHERGLIHRDIKPANIWLESRGDGRAACRPDNQAIGGPPVATGGRVKLLDFGLARALQGEEPGLSRPGRLLGTPSYMAPEQARGEAVDHRADLFSLGCVLYRLATGRPPFHGADALAVLVRIATDDPAPPRQLNPAVPAALADLIVRLLAKDPAKRPPSARAVADALRTLEDERAGRGRLARRRRLALTGVVILAACGLTAWLAWRAGAPPPAEPGTVTFAFDEPGVPLLLRRGEDEQTLDLSERRPRPLPAGDYAVRPAVDTNGRRLLPDHFTLKPGEARTVALRLVGEVRRHEEHGEVVWAVAVTPRRGKPLALSASRDHSIGVWDLGTGAKPALLDHHNPVHCVAASADGRLAASGGGRPAARTDLTVHLWDLEALQPAGTLAGHRSLITALAFAPDGKRLLSGSADGKALLWDLATGQAQPLDGHNGLGVTGAAFAADGKAALTCGGDGLVLVWDVAGGKVLHTLKGHEDAVHGVAFAPDGTAAASVGQDHTLRVWDLKTCEARVFRGQAPLHAVAFAPDGGRLLTGGADGCVRLWDVAALREVYCFEGHRGAVHGVAFTADGRRAVSGGADATVRLWELPE
jgi:WD40 repeat protein/tRNA A-37 threonylcarbamoyl transferase component Bud32